VADPMTGTRYSFGSNHRGGAWPIFDHYRPTLLSADLFRE
jgi:hypothetical protein